MRRALNLSGNVFKTPGQLAAEILRRDKPNLSVLKAALAEMASEDGKELPPALVTLFPTFLDKFGVSDKDIPEMARMMARLARKFEEIKTAREDSIDAQ